MSALDHWLNVLDIALKHGDRKAEQKADAREERRQSRTQRAFADAPAPTGVTGVKIPADPSCCLAKRRFTK